MTTQPDILSLLKAIEQLPSGPKSAAPTVDSNKSDLELYFTEREHRLSFYNQRLCDVGNILLSQRPAIAQHPDKQKLLTGFGVLLDNLSQLSMGHYLTYVAQFLAIQQDPPIDTDFRQKIFYHYKGILTAANSTIKEIVEDDKNWHHLPKVIYFYAESKRLRITENTELSQTLMSKLIDRQLRKARKMLWEKIMCGRNIADQNER